ncbi:hypothetical protein [Kitasatospora sp. NPDC059327]|uniref:hypothetical protein n=1 Tax=Kitasatospora sp. NPDC059327 TaxID=3346803 RepID=UPI003679FD73
MEGNSARSEQPSIPPDPHGRITSARFRRILAWHIARLPGGLVLCHYKPAQALCHRDRPEQGPRLDHCRPTCTNIARTDHHAAQLRRRAELLDRQADHAPAPVAERPRASAQRLAAPADHHDRTRTTHQDPA